MGIFIKLKSFAWECKRVLTVTKKPTKAELMTVVKVSGIGIAFIGIIGFVLHIVNRLVFQQ
ncbi:protein translocase SEC61 complex subunit gamma [Candidatus Woesearchaeota archaeon]|nr:protein translocase SEC61 complex subunit gamma [Candidatus Woesearchaeota archaeon]